MKRKAVVAKAFGSRLRELRQMWDMSLQDVGDIIDASGSTVGNWEKGLNAPNLVYVLRLAQYFEVDLEDLCLKEKA